MRRVNSVKSMLDWLVLTRLSSIPVCAGRTGLGSKNCWPNSVEGLDGIVNPLYRVVAETSESSLAPELLGRFAVSESIAEGFETA